MRVLIIVVAVLGITGSRAAAGPDVIASVHTLGSVVFGQGRASSSGASGGLTAGVDLEVGSDGTNAVLMLEELWRKPAAYDAAHERSLTVLVRHHFPERGRGRAGYIGAGGGVRRVDTSDDAGALTLRGYDFRLEGGVAMASWARTTMHLRFGLTYGCYTRGIHEDGRRESVGCFDTLLGQMFIGLDLARRW